MEKLPSIIVSSKLGTQTAKETTLPCGSSLILNKWQNLEASTPNPRTYASHPVYCALLQLEKVIGTKKQGSVNWTTCTQRGFPMHEIMCM